MAALVPMKTWVETTNQAVASDMTQTYANPDYHTANKNLFIGITGDFIASGHWAAEGSSDSTTAAMDGVNRLTTPAGIRHNALGGNPHSWLVLRQIATGLYVLFNFESFTTSGGGGRYMEIYVSRNAFTGGSTTVRPASLEEGLLRTGADPGHQSKWHWGDSGLNWRWHAWHATDGTISMAVGYQNGVMNTVWYFGALRYAPANWSTPWGLICAPGFSFNVDYFDYSSCWTQTEMQAVYAPQQSPGGIALAQHTTHTVDNDAGATNIPIFQQIIAANSSGKYDVFPAGLTVRAQGPFGLKGYFFDMYWDGAADSGDIDTDSLGGKWVKLGDEGVYVPWHPSDSFLMT